LPCAASGFSAAIAEKVLLNDVAEIVGVAPDVVELDVVELDVAGVLDAVVELLVDGGVAALDLLCEFELPHAATASAAATVRAAVIALLFSKRTIDLLYGALCDTSNGAQERTPSPGHWSLRVRHATTAAMNEALTSRCKT
jgi:hypothetical protein